MAADYKIENGKLVKNSPNAPKFEIVQKSGEYPAGGPTVPGSSTGIGSTMTGSGGKVSPGGSGYSGVGLSPNAYGTGSYAAGSSPAEIQAAKEKVIAQEKARREAFSKTGGLVGIGQASPYFKTTTQDIKTDSQAIKTATQIADQATTGAKMGMISTPKPQPQKDLLTQGLDFITRSTAPQQQDLEIAYKTKEGKNKVKIIRREDYEFVGQNKAIQNVIGTGSLISVTGKPRSSELGEFAIETAASYPIFMGGGLLFDTVSKAAAPVVKTVLTPVTKTLSPVTKQTTKIITGTLNETFKSLTPTTQKVVLGVTKKEGTKKALEAGKVLVKTELTGEGLRQVGLATPDIISTAYLTATPNRVFKPTPETEKIAGEVYQASRVNYYGGIQNIVDKEGRIIETKQIPSKTSMGEGFAEGYLPGIKVATGFAKEFETQTIEKIKDNPDYKKLSAKEKRQYEKEFKDYYLNISQIGQTLGQVAIETGGEVTGRGRLVVLAGKGIKTRGEATWKFGLASGSTGIQEGIYSTELSGKTERREITNEERLISGAAGGVVAGGFGALQGYTTGTKKQRVVNIIGELVDYPYEPLGDVIGDKVADVLKIPNIKVNGSLVKTSYGPSVTASTSTTTKDSGKKKTKSFDLVDYSKLSSKDKTNYFFGLKTDNISLPGTSTKTGASSNIPQDVDNKGKKITDNVPPKEDDESDDETKEDDESDDETKENVSTNTPTFVNVKTTIPVIAPQGFGFPGLFPLGSNRKAEARGKTKIYDELSAAGKRFQQLSGLPFVEQKQNKKPNTVLINGKEYRLGKRVKK